MYGIHISAMVGEAVPGLPCAVRGRINFYLFDGLTEAAATLQAELGLSRAQRTELLNHLVLHMDDEDGVPLTVRVSACQCDNPARHLGYAEDEELAEIEEQADRLAAWAGLIAA